MTTKLDLGLPFSLRDEDKNEQFYLIKTKLALNLCSAIISWAVLIDKASLAQHQFFYNFFYGFIQIAVIATVNHVPQRVTTGSGSRLSSGDSSLIICMVAGHLKENFLTDGISLLTNGKSLQISSPTRCKAWASHITWSIFGWNIWNAVLALPHTAWRRQLAKNIIVFYSLRLN